ncbi:hypothetical protein C8034_v001135 [Colletotrichum sidae]|uniref:GED domain-containing protein n=1 Tax=Colletotrichum sidae TaxID=1347389 RepID=A0A4R8TE54_9PEZI|nr:hypothetical protein C8034_v001135 [Colletotrichum sidae]
MFKHIHHSMEENMMNDVHDVIKVYYQLSLDSFIRHVTNDIVENFVTCLEGPLMGLSTDWVLALSEEEVRQLARDDDETVRKRAHYDDVIRRLEEASAIVARARSQTRGLGEV